eukprot:TRINITY_DN16845_c0_g1_i1.p1 TRINITY_DN16845_c0_g1~~TRINITY_DN16845_c0_g1_i1.p1  ORF type:complete len:266 (+),score=37.70 TRINITY_DN16845_c0_g1_i1:57-854(+)
MVLGLLMRLCFVIYRFFAIVLSYLERAWECKWKHSSKTLSEEKMSDLMQNLAKVPRHVGIVLDERQRQKKRHTSAKDWKDIVHVVYWLSLIESLESILIFDAARQYNNVELNLFRKALSDFFVDPQVSADKKHVILKQHKTSKESRSQALTILFLSANDSFEPLADIIRQKIKQKKNSNNKEKSNLVSQEYLQKTLSADVPDPELILKFDGTDFMNAGPGSMPGFPPWRIAISELLNLHTIHNISWCRLFSALQWYSNSVQRGGK